MAAESELNKRIQAAIADLDPRRVENSVGPGTPDINYVFGWIEDKAVPFPVRGGVVKVDHYVKEQRAWHRRRRAAGGIVLVCVEDTRSGAHYVFDAWKAAAHLGIDWTAEQMQKHSIYFSPSWDPVSFRKFILGCKP